MNQPLPQFQLPKPPTRLSLVRSPTYSDLTKKMNEHADWATRATVYFNTWANQAQRQLNSQVQGEGDVIASADAISPTNPIHHVSGNAAIKTINAPSGFSGPIWLLMQGAPSFVTGGNIALAKGPFTPGQAVRVVYSQNTRMWYPE
jgi:hypothetical protein